MRSLTLILALALAAGPAAADNLYKWTDKDGKVHYTDHLPPPEAKVLERKKFGDKPSDIPVPYSLQKAVKNFPVILYSADCGDPCTKASAFLAQRGVPFTEKDARDPAVAQELKVVNGGKVEVPVMKLGSQVLFGYHEGSWRTALDAAGYPTSPVGPVPAATPKPSVAPKAQTPKPEAAPAQSPQPSAQKENPR